jgi:hypothetical protein
MPEQDFLHRYEQASGAADIFELVKDSVRRVLNRERAGLMLGLSDLGITPQGFVGGFHQAGSNAIILNSAVLKRISRARPEFLKPYSFSVILHEYLHTLGILDEARTRILTFKICQDMFGESHPVTRISEDFNGMAREIVLKGGPEEPSSTDISFVDRIDDDEMRYIG